MSEITQESSKISEASSPSSDEIDRKLPWLIVVGVLAMAAIIFGLGRIAIINSDRRDAEKKRGDAEARRGDDLQKSVDALKSNQQEERKFFELVRELMLAQGQDQKQALLDQLRGFRFTEPTTTTTTTAPRRGTTTTTTTPNSSPTTAPRPPPSTTTTTAPPSPPPSRPCVTTPVINVCPPTASSNERKRS